MASFNVTADSELFKLVIAAMCRFVCEYGFSFSWDRFVVIAGRELFNLAWRVFVSDYATYLFDVGIFRACCKTVF